jgi:hypothetical protein
MRQSATVGLREFSASKMNCAKKAQMPRLRIIVFILGMVATLGPSSRALSQSDTYALTIKGGQFEPREIVIPAKQKISLIVENLDATPSEFESTDLGREKVVAPGARVTVFIGPLRAGRYEFFDDFKPDTPHGYIVAR